MERKYDNLERMRKDIQKDRDKIAALQEQIKVKEARLREAEATRVVADVEAMGLSPEQVGSVLDLIQSGQIRIMMNGNKVMKAISKAKEDSEDDET